MVTTYSHRFLSLLCCMVFCCTVTVSANAASAAEAIWTLPDQVVPGVAVSLPLTVRNFENINSYNAPIVTGANWEPNVRSTGSRRTNINGAVSQETTYVFQITFQAEGTYTIPPLTLSSANGTTLATQEIKIVVSNTASVAASQCRAEIHLEPNDVVAGEEFEVVYTVSLRAHKQLGISELGFAIPQGILEIGDDLRKSTRNEYDKSGRLWEISTYRKKLTVSKPGNYTFTGQQNYGKIIRSFVGRQLQKTGTVAIKPASLTVRTLPHQGQPASFQGLVGKIQVHSSIERERISLGEGVRLSVQISDGQIDLVHRIDVPKIAGFAIYSGDTSHDSDNNSKTFTWSLVPEKAGMYTIPEISIPYYDPQGKRYRFANSERIALSVIPGRKRDLGMTGNTLHKKTTGNQLSDAGLILPAPLYGMNNSSLSLSSQSIWLGLGYGALAALALAGLKSLGRRERTRSTDLQTLISALRNNNIQAANQSLHTLMPLLADNSTVSAQSLQTAIEQARFGGGSLTREHIIQAQSLELKK